MKLQKWNINSAISDSVIRSFRSPTIHFFRSFQVLLLSLRLHPVVSHVTSTYYAWFLNKRSFVKFINSQHDTVIFNYHRLHYFQMKLLFHQNILLSPEVLKKEYGRISWTKQTSTCKILSFYQWNFFFNIKSFNLISHKDSNWWFQRSPEVIHNIIFICFSYLLETIKISPKH